MPRNEQVAELRREYASGDLAPEAVDHMRQKAAEVAVREGEADAFDVVAAVRDLSAPRPTPADLAGPERDAEYIAALDALNARILESIRQGAGVPEAYAADRDTLERRINALGAYRRVGIF